MLSPLVEVGEADFIVSFEKLEALRWAHYLRESGCIKAVNVVLLGAPPPAKTLELNLQAFTAGFASASMAVQTDF